MSFNPKGNPVIKKHRALVGDAPVPTDENGRRQWTSYEDYLRDQKKIHEEMKSKPAITCELCGYPMNYKGHKVTKWEATWSVHEVCKKKMNNLLDRQSGILRDRKG